MLNEEEKRELRDLAKSSKLREDMRRLCKRRHNPFIVDGSIDLDKFLLFLTEYNYFINHTPKIFHKIIDKDMRL